MKRFSRNVWIVTAASMFTDISSEMVVYLLPLFLAGVLGAPVAVVGLIEGVAETTASVMKLFSGWLSDRLDRRKWLTTAGYALSVVAKTGLLTAATWPAVLATRFVDRLGKGIRTAPRDALIAASVDEKSRGAAFGFHRAGDTLGAFLGVGISAGIVYATQAFSVALTRETFVRVLAISLIPAVAAVVLLAGWLQELPRRGAPAARPRFSLAGFDARFRAFLLVVGVFALGNSADAFIVLRAQSLGASTVAVLLLVLGFNFVYTVAASPIGHLSDRVGRSRLIVAGWMLYGVVYLAFGVASSVAALAAVWALYGLYYALTEGVVKAFIADLVPSELRGSAYGMYAAVVGVVALPASALAGLFWQGFGPAAPFLFGAAMAALAVLLWIVCVRPATKTC